MRCLSCEFYNQPDALSCLDCGEVDFVNPKLFGEEKEDTSQLISMKFVFTATAAVVLAVVFIMLTTGDEVSRTSLFFAISFGLLISVLISMLMMNSKEYKTRRDRRRRNIATIEQVTLSSIANEVDYKMQLLTRENRELIDLFAPVYEDDEADKIEYVETNETDKLLFETVEIQLDLCKMQSDEIELIRIESEILYHRKTLNDVVEPAVAEDEETIEDLFQELQYLQDSYEYDENNSYIDVLLPRQDMFFKKIDSAQKKCKEVSDEITEKQTARQRGLNYFSRQRPGFSSGDQQFADFNIKHILADYNGAFAELESEYQRLKAADRRSGYLIG